MIKQIRKRRSLQPISLTPFQRGVANRLLCNSAQGLFRDALIISRRAAICQFVPPNRAAFVFSVVQNLVALRGEGGLNGPQLGGLPVRQRQIVKDHALDGDPLVPGVVRVVQVADDGVPDVLSGGKEAGREVRRRISDRDEKVLDLERTQNGMIPAKRVILLAAEKRTH